MVGFMCAYAVYMEVGGDGNALIKTTFCLARASIPYLLAHNGFDPVPHCVKQNVILINAFNSLIKSIYT
jgi:hypothetical protein